MARAGDLGTDRSKANSNNAWIQTTQAIASVGYALALEPQPGWRWALIGTAARVESRAHERGLDSLRTEHRVPALGEEESEFG